MLTYDFWVKEGVSNTILIPCTLPTGILVGHFYASQRADSQGSELAGTVTFNAGSGLAIITLTAAQSTISNFPRLYTLTVSASGGAETILSAGRACLLLTNPPGDDPDPPDVN